MVDDAAMECGYSPMILVCNLQVQQWQPTKISKVNALLPKIGLQSVNCICLNKFVPSKVGIVECTTILI